MRKLLYKLLGLENYLKIVSFVYIRLIKLGYGKRKYKELYFLRNIVKEGFTCIDIGANLGYYSYFLTKYAGETGKVYAIEPIPLFGKILKKNVKSKNFNLFTCALGAENKTVEMGLPIVNGKIHHGMTKIVNKEEYRPLSGVEMSTPPKYAKMFDVEMKKPAELFSKIEKIDFIKADIEGYESVVFENMKEIITKHKPLIQCELSGQENRIKTINILKEIGYKTFRIGVYTDSKCDISHLFSEINTEDIPNYNDDFYFVI